MLPVNLNELSIYNAAGRGDRETIRTLFKAGADLNGYKDYVSKSVHILLGNTLEHSALMWVK